MMGSSTPAVLVISGDHGPATTTTVSEATGPRLVITPVTRPSAADIDCTWVPVRIEAPRRLAAAAKPVAAWAGSA